MVSRRALNGILRNRSRSRFLNEAFFASGYSAKPLDVSMQVSMRRRSQSEESRLAWGALTRMTNFPIMIGQWSIALMLLGCAAAIANALTVRFFQHDTPAGCLDLPHRPSGALACGPEVISASDLRYRWIAMGSACQFTGLVV